MTTVESFNSQNQLTSQISRQTFRNKDFTKFDAQIGITGTVISNETFWQCAVRETMEECNIDISNEKSIKTIKDYNRILYIIEI